MNYAIFARSDEGAWSPVTPPCEGDEPPQPLSDRKEAERLATELGKSGSIHVVVAANTAVMAEELLLRLNQVNLDLVDLDALLLTPDVQVPAAIRAKIAELREHANPS